MAVSSRRSNSGRKRAPVSNTDISMPEDTPVDDSSAAATKLSISRTVNAFFANKNMSRRTCACCNELFSPSKMKSVKSAGDWLLRLRNRLSWAFTTHELTDETRRFYDVSEIEPALADVPLAKAGIVPDPSDTSGPCLVRVMTSFLLNLFSSLFDSVFNLNSHSQVLLCLKCWMSLRRSKAASKSLPPGLAICNNFAVVPLPKHIIDHDPTWAELSVCARAQVGVSFRVLGSHKRQLRSHALVFINDTPAALELPREVTPEEYMVVFAKLSDSELQVGQKKRLLVRRHVTDRLLSHYRKNLDDYREKPTNHSYARQKGFSIQTPALKALTVMLFATQMKQLIGQDAFND